MRLLSLMLLLLVSLIGCASPEPVSDAGDGDDGGDTAPEVSKGGVVNVYSARHYDVDSTLFERFKAETGIEVQLIEGDSATLLERLRREGEAGPADVFIAVDAGRLHQAVEEGVFQPIETVVLNERVPESLRHPDGLWFGLTKRARVLMVAKDRVEPGAISTYEELAEPEWKDRVLIRSSSNIYNQSLVGSILAAHGVEATEAWCRGVVDNMARSPQGGDSDQIRALAAGEGDVAVANTYYLAKMIANADKPEDQAAAAEVTVVFPNQGDGDRGAHVNISGAGVVRGAPNRENAVALLEFLTGDEAQNVWAGGNKEYSVVPGLPSVPELEGFGAFREDPINASVFGANNKEALMIMDRCGWR